MVAAEAEILDSSNRRKNQGIRCTMERIKRACVCVKANISQSIASLSRFQIGCNARRVPTNRERTMPGVLFTLEFRNAVGAAQN